VRITPETDVVASLAVTIDGYIARTDGAVDYLDKYPMDDFDFTAFTDTIGALIMGRATYEVSLGFGWAWGDMPTMVLTHQTDLPIPDDANVTLSDQPTAQAIRAFSADTPKRLWVHGGGRVIAEGLAGGAIDTLDLMVMPEALGAGVPLFAAPYSGPMRLIENTGFASGPVRLIYDTSPA
jgi:dihydrofolate reductase